MSNPQYYELMCRDHVVASFLWDSESSQVVGKARVHDIEYAPFGCIDRTGVISKVSLSTWLSNRSIPALRPHAVERLQEQGISSSVDLMVVGFGLSLSDQYWIKPQGENLCWDDVNYFDHEFSPLLGELLLNHDPDSIPKLQQALSDSAMSLGASPDAALNGNLPKRWECRGGERVLVKGGKPENRFQEPANELATTALCGLVLGKEDYVPYHVEGTSFPDYRSVCPCMVDARTEFVPAISLYRSFKKQNNENLYGFFVRVCREHGLEPTQSLEKMLTVDFLTANWDRHWNNFGVFIDCETREWLRVSPIFDTGESFWCDKALTQAFDGYRTKAGAERPFGTDIDAQFERYCTDLSWLDTDALQEFIPLAREALTTNAMVVAEPGRLDVIERALQQRVDAVIQRAERNRGRLIKSISMARSESFAQRCEQARIGSAAHEGSKSCENGIKRDGRNAR